MPRELRKSRNGQPSVPEFSKEEEKNTMDMIKEYEGMSESELMTKLLGSVQKGKQDGTFSEDMLNNFIKQASPMLNEEQRSKMTQIADMLK